METLNEILKQKLAEFDEKFVVSEIICTPLPEYQGKKIVFEEEAINATHSGYKSIKSFITSLTKEISEAQWEAEKLEEKKCPIRKNTREVFECEFCFGHFTHNSAVKQQQEKHKSFIG